MRIRLFPFILVLLFCAASLTGCGQQKKIPIPEFIAKTPIPISSTTKQKPFYLERVIAGLKRGTVIGARYSGYTESVAGVCNHHNAGLMTWSGGRTDIGGMASEFSEVFFSTLTSYGYDVAGDPAKVFRQQEDYMRAKLRLAATIKDIKTNFCTIGNVWDGGRVGTDQGEMYMKVKWDIYSVEREEMLVTFMTEGYFKQVTPVNDGFDLLVIEAFADAASQLAGIQKFHDLVLGRIEHKSTQPVGIIGDRVLLEKVDPYTTDFQYNSDKALNGAVTIRVPNGHGSGLIVSDDGYILTNAHVVGDAKTVSVRFRAGFELVGEVIKVHKRRDVALVKVNISHATAMPIRKTPLNLGEAIIAIGTPTQLKYNHSVTKGIVSAFRNEKHEGPLIQGDVDIHGGNSGGALLDANGNVVGITVAALTDSKNKFSVGTNFFIPIEDALRKLNISLIDKK